MQLRINHDYESLSSAAADLIIECVNTKPQAVLCFATGDSPKRTYEILQKRIINSSADFSRCFFLGLDEWLGIPPDNSGTCHYFLHKYLFTPLGIEASRFHLFNALTSDPAAECRLMDDLIKEKGGIDLMLVGVGMNGHIGFNEPGTSVQAMAHVAELDHTTRTVGKKYFETEVPIHKGITIGMKQVLGCRKLMMIASGNKKAPVIRRALEEEITENFPASLVRTHPNSVLLIDTEAASELETKKNGSTIN